MVVSHVGMRQLAPFRLVAPLQSVATAESTVIAELAEQLILADSAVPDRHFATRSERVMFSYLAAQCPAYTHYSSSLFCSCLFSDNPPVCLL
jgi:hypothetical protein